MGAGNPKLYRLDKDGNRKQVSSRWSRVVYKNNGKYYIVTGNAWTGFYRNEITEEQYNKAIDLMASWTENNQEYQQLPKWVKPETRLQKAYFHSYVGNNVWEYIK